MPIKLDSDIELWKRIENYSFDASENVPLSFLDKLCKENQWTKAFGKSAIEEYKKFVFLCCVMPKGASPSDVVDKVWHLHLTYTKSYWDDFCKNVLRKPLHHYPSDGTHDKSRSLNDKYKDTLWAYHDYFDQLPITAYWPIPIQNESFNKNSGFPLKYVFILIAFLIVYPIFLGKSFVFLLNGEDFLSFYLYIVVLGFILLIIDKIRFSSLQQEFILQNISKRPNSFQIAYYLFGTHHALQAAIMNLVECRILKITKDNIFEFSNEKVILENENLSENPMKEFALSQKERNFITYEEIGREWFNKGNFEHLELEGIQKELKTFRFTFPLIFVPILGVIRIGQGIINDYPITYLIIELIFAGLFYYLLQNFFLDHNDDFKTALINKYFPKDRDRDSTDLFSLEGRSVLANLTFGYLLMDIFPRYNRTGQKKKSNCSSCTSSSCSSGGNDSSSGCSGGGGDGGGGCGGCGGGGD